MKIEGKNKLGAVAIVALMCMMAFGAVIITVPENAQAAYWYPDYDSGHRHEYTITNSELTAKTNVTVNIYLTEASNPDLFDNCLATGWDIIFTNWESDVRYEHYMAYWNYADHDALFQVTVPSIAASTTDNIWIYYGYAAATNLSDGDAVFELFDDFNYSEYRNQTTAGMVSILGGAIFDKFATPTYTPDSAAFHTSEEKIMGISSVYNATEGSIAAYGSYMNTSFAAILGMNSTTGYDDTWTQFSNVLVNHSATGASPDFLKATEPDFLTDISEESQRAAVKEHGIALQNYTLYYSGLNITNYSICMATSPILDAEYTKNESNPVIMHGKELEFDGAGARKPVAFKISTNSYGMLYSGLNSTTSEWKVGYATSSNQ